MYNNYLLGTCNCFTMVTNLNLIHQKMVTKGIFHFKREMLKLQRVLNNLAKVNQLTNGRGGSQTQVGL